MDSKKNTAPLLTPLMRWFLFTMALFGIGVGMMNPAYQSLVSEAVPEKLRGTAFALFQTSIGLVSLPARYIGAKLWERLTPRTPFLITSAGLLLSTLPVWWKFRLPERMAETSDDLIHDVQPAGEGPADAKGSAVFSGGKSEASAEGDP